MHKYLNIKESKKHLLKKNIKKENNNPNKNASNRLKIVSFNIKKLKAVNNNKENYDINILTDFGKSTVQNETKRIKNGKNKNNINKEKQKDLEYNKYSKKTYNNNVIKLQKKIIHNRKNISSIPLFKNYILKTLTTKNSNKGNLTKNLNSKMKYSINESNNHISNKRNSVIITSNYYKDENNKLTDNFKSADVSPSHMKKIITKNKNNILTQNLHLKNKSMIIGQNKKKARGVIKLSIIDINNKEKNNKTINITSSNTIKIFLNEINVDKNPQKVEEYLEDIYSHLKSIDNINLPMKDYMKIVQKDINEKMRTKLLDWLINVHSSFKLLPETLFLTINIIDKYLSKISIKRKYLQLLGITSMFIASKYEDIYPPEIKDFIFMTNNSYSKEELIKLESDILDKIEFNLTFPTTLRFLEIFKEFLNLKEIDYFRCRYFIEIALFDYKCCHFSTRLIAASSIILNQKINISKNKKYIDNNLLKTIEYDLEQLTPCLLCLINAINQMMNPNNKYSSIRRKFEKEEFYKVSKDKIKMDNIFIDDNKIKI